MPFVRCLHDITLRVPGAARVNVGDSIPSRDPISRIKGFEFLIIREIRTRNPSPPGDEVKTKDTFIKQVRNALLYGFGEHLLPLPDFPYGLHAANMGSFSVACAGRKMSTLTRVPSRKGILMSFSNIVSALNAA